MMKGLNRDYVTTLSFSPNRTVSVLPSLPPHLLLSAVGLLVLGWAPGPQRRELGVLALLPAVQFSWVWQTAVGPVPGRLLDQR